MWHDRVRLHGRNVHPSIKLIARTKERTNFGRTPNQ